MKRISASPLLSSFSDCDCAGVDEVGRGPLAGPVLACAVIIPENLWQKLQAGQADWLGDVACSKALSAKMRQELQARLKASCPFAIACASARVIDHINIRQATLLAMQRAILRLPVVPKHVLVDGRDCPDVPYPTRAIIKGDAQHLAIAAASIIAKHARDRLMQKLHHHMPSYDWNRNAGYGTKAHLIALARHGATHHHRQSFAPIKNTGI
ncbi:MAG: ribonuclease HII [Pseudomonadota bacterium]